MSEIYDIKTGRRLSEIVVLDACLKEIKKFPRVVQKEFLDITNQLKAGFKFSMPTSRPMTDIGKGVHELRLKDKSGQFRLFYVFKSKDGKIYFLHAFKKKTQTTPMKNINLAKRRLKGVSSETTRG